MKNPRTFTLHDVGQRLWRDTINRQLLRSGALARHIRECSATRLTSNPTILKHAIALGQLRDKGFDDNLLAERLQREDTEGFAKSGST